MAFESVRSYIQLASGLGEMTKARAMEAAQGLLSLPGADEVTRRAVQASTLADQLLEAAKSNRANLVALVQHEVELAQKRAEAARAAEAGAAQAAVSALAKELADLRGMLRAGGAMVGRRSGAVSTRVRAGSPLAQPETTRATGKPATAKKATARRATTKKTTAKRATAKKATAKKATATKATGAAATKTTATKTASKRATSTKKADS